MRHAIEILLFLSLSTFAFASAARSDRGVREEVRTRQDGDVVARYQTALWCPTQFVGSMCPENGIFSYYKCCGELNQHCCSHWRTWVIVGAIVLPLIIIGLVILLLIKLFCFRNRRERYSPGTRVTSNTRRTNDGHETATEVRQTKRIITVNK